MRVDGGVRRVEVRAMWIAGGAEVRAVWRHAGCAGDVVVEVCTLGDAGGGQVRGGARGVSGHM